MVDFEIDAPKKRLHLTLDEDLSSTHVASMRDAWTGFKAGDTGEAWTTVYFDLRETRILDSVGLNWLFSFSKELTASKKKLLIRVSSPAIKRVLDFANFEQFADIRFRRRRQTR